MKALGKFVVVEIQKVENKVTKAGIIVAQSGEQYTTNSGDKVGVAHKNVVADIGPAVTISVQKGDEVIVNPWALQLFEVDDKTYGVIPEEEVKVVL